MPSILDNVKTNILSANNEIIPIRIGVDESFYNGSIDVSFGKKRLFHKPANVTINLEFDSFYESNIITLRKVIHNRQYNKMLFVNEPADSKNLLDFNNTETVGNYCYYSESNTTPGSLTELSAGDYSKIVNIDSNCYDKSWSTLDYCWMYMSFNTTDFYRAYGSGCFERFTLFLHNPYSYFNSGINYSYDGISAFYLDTSSDSPGWIPIGEQTYTITDAHLRTAGKMNQQFFSVRKTQNFYKMVNTTNFIIAFRNTNPRPTGMTGHIGFNYAGAAINGYGVKLAGPDNFTYRDSWDGSGSVGTITLKEV